jgi:hypothetical protein
MQARIRMSGQPELGQPGRDGSMQGRYGWSGNRLDLSQTCILELEYCKAD